MGCRVSENTSVQVVLTCPSAALQLGVTLLADLAATGALTPPALPLTGILVMGHFIHGQGMVPNLGVITVDTGQRGTVAVGGSLSGAGGTLCAANTLGASGILIGGGNISAGSSTGSVPLSGSITLSSANGSLPLGNVVINGGNLTPSPPGGGTVSNSGSIALGSQSGIAALQNTGTQTSGNSLALSSGVTP